MAALADAPFIRLIPGPCSIALNEIGIFSNRHQIEHRKRTQNHVQSYQNVHIDSTTLPAVCSQQNESRRHRHSRHRRQPNWRQIHKQCRSMCSQCKSRQIVHDLGQSEKGLVCFCSAFKFEQEQIEIMYTFREAKRERDIMRKSQ